MFVFMFDWLGGLVMLLGLVVWLCWVLVGGLVSVCIFAVVVIYVLCFFGCDD